MTKSPYRFLSLLLIPCLLADPLTASGLTRSRLPAHQNKIPFLHFQAQAISVPMVLARRLSSGWPARSLLTRWFKAFRKWIQADPLPEPDVLLDRIEPLSRFPDPMETADHVKRRFLEFYTAVLELLSVHGLFDGQVLIYPAAGLDILPSRYVDTIVLNDTDLEAIARAELGDLGPSQSRLLYWSDVEGRSVPFYVDRFQPDQPRKRTILFKGIISHMFSSDLEGFREYLEALSEFLNPGDRILILDHRDAAQAVPILLAKGLRLRDDWLPQDPMRRLEAALERSGDYQSIFQTMMRRWYFLFPTAVTVLEKTEGLPESHASVPPELAFMLPMPWIQRLLQKMTPTHQAKMRVVAA